MRVFYFLSVLICSASVMGMPKKVSITPLSETSEEDFGSIRGGTLQNLAAVHDPYPVYLVAPFRSDERPRQSLNAIRGLDIYDLPFTIYPKRYYYIAKKSLDSIGGGHLI